MITNTSNCNLYIDLRLQLANEDQLKNNSLERSQIDMIIKESFKFDCQKGLVNAKSKKKVNITFKPTTRFEFEINLVCVAREKMPKDLAKSVKMDATARGKPQKANFIEKSSIKIFCKGDYPLLRFTDVRNEQVSIANLWERFALTTLNKEMLQPLN